MITDYKITEIFCATDEFSKKFDEEIENMPLLGSDGKARRRRAASMSDSEIMTILMMFHFSTFDNFKHYYLHFIRIHLRRDFPERSSCSVLRGPTWMTGTRRYGLCSARESTENSLPTGDTSRPTCLMRSLPMGCIW